jgi:hypothetical protein
MKNIKTKTKNRTKQEKTGKKNNSRKPNVRDFGH